MITDSAIKKFAKHHRRYGKVKQFIRLYAEALSEQGNNDVKAFMYRAINHHTTSGEVKDLKRASTSWFKRSLECLEKGQREHALNFKQTSQFLDIIVEFLEKRDGAEKPKRKRVVKG